MTRLVLPAAPTEPDPPPFPIFAALAPVVGALVLFAFLQSPYVLLFAVLGPLIAVASIADRRIGRRRSRRRAQEAFEEEAELLRTRVADLVRHALALLTEQTPTARAQGRRDAQHPGRWRWQQGELPVVIGVGDCPTPLALDEPTAASGPVRDLFDELRSTAGKGQGPVTADARLGLGVHGPAPVAEAIVRTLLVQVLEAVSPEAGVVIVEAGRDWSWLEQGPHRVERAPTRRPGSVLVRVLTDQADFTLAAAPEAEDLPRECGLRVQACADMIELGGSRVRTETIAEHEARAHVAVLADAAAAAGIMTESSIPDRVMLAELPAAPADGLAATFLMGQSPVTVDIAADGPHAVVGGTTGSGKSELLIAWVTALARAHDSERLNILLVDFKGGASFGELEHLRHCVGLMTDLDEEGAARAIASLSAELRRRERRLAELGARSIDETAAIPRLVVVVDEFAAMLQELPDLHRLFVDVAARGRSLGVHLILCTQRPADAVRDALMTNCGLRLCLRVNDDPDSVAVVGTPDAARFSLEQRGRCVVRISGQGSRTVQTAMADPALISSTVRESASGPEPYRPYLPPLPLEIPGAGAGAAAADAVVFAWVDRPAQQRQDPVQWHPSDGSVLILGSAASGKTSAAHRFCEQGDAALVDSAESLWDALADPPAHTVTVIDDIDMLLMQMGEQHAHDLTAALQRRMREASAAGRAFVLTARRMHGGLSGAAALAEHTIVLRMPTRQEHAIAGGASEFVPGLPAGAGWLGEERVQLVRPQRVADPVTARAVDYEGDSCAVVAARPDALPAALRRGVAPGQDGPVIVGTPAQWEAAWGSLERAMQERPVLLVDTAERQLRPLLRGAVQLPFCSGPGRWLVVDGRADRLRLVTTR